MNQQSLQIGLSWDDHDQLILNNYPFLWKYIPLCEYNCWISRHYCVLALPPLVMSLTLDTAESARSRGRANGRTDLPFPFFSPAIRTPPKRNVCIPGRSQIWILNNFNFSVYEREKTIHLSDRRGITCHENICSAIPPAARPSFILSTSLLVLRDRGLSRRTFFLFEISIICLRSLRWLWCFSIKLPMV